ncbi:MAG: hypothetical protein WAX66_02605 [Patescibacteria group bacterium]
MKGSIKAVEVVERSGEYGKFFEVDLGIIVIQSRIDSEKAVSPAGFYSQRKLETLILDGIFIVQVPKLIEITPVFLETLQPSGFGVYRQGELENILSKKPEKINFSILCGDGWLSGLREPRLWEFQVKVPLYEDEKVQYTLIRRGFRNSEIENIKKIVHSSMSRSEGLITFTIIESFLDFLERWS